MADYIRHREYSDVDPGISYSGVIKHILDKILPPNEYSEFIKPTPLPQDSERTLPPEFALGAEGAKFMRAIEEAKLRRAVADYKALRELDEEAERIWRENEEFKKSLEIRPMDSKPTLLTDADKISPLKEYRGRQLNKYTIPPIIPLPLEKLLPPRNEDSLPFPQKTRKPADLGDFSF